MSDSHFVPSKQCERLLAYASQVYDIFAESTGIDLANVYLGEFGGYLQTSYALNKFLSRIPRDEKYDCYIPGLMIGLVADLISNLRTRYMRSPDELVLCISRVLERYPPKSPVSRSEQEMLAFVSGIRAELLRQTGSLDYEVPVGRNYHYGLAALTFLGQYISGNSPAAKLRANIYLDEALIEYYKLLVNHKNVISEYDDTVWSTLEAIGCCLDNSEQKLTSLIRNRNRAELIVRLRELYGDNPYAPLNQISLLVRFGILDASLYDAELKASRTGLATPLEENLRLCRYSWIIGAEVLDEPSCQNPITNNADSYKQRIFGW